MIAPSKVHMTDGPTIDVTKVSDKGQVVIPKEIRDRLQLVPGTKLIVVATEDAVVLQRIETVAGKMKMRDIMEMARSITDRFKLGKG
jgi:AbrB family looped-hinge helix DNA binding protein